MKFNAVKFNPTNNKTIKRAVVVDFFEVEENSVLESMTC